MAPLDGGQQPTPTDLAILWQKAVQSYNSKVGKTGTKLRGDGFGLVKNLDGVYAAIDANSDSFKEWRHPEGDKLVRFRTFIGENLDKVQWVGDLVASAASGVFPAAGGIWTVVTYAISTCQTQSKDYDQLMALIGEAGAFINTLKILEEKLPDRAPYVNCVFEALSALMTVFAIQTRHMYEKRRLLQYWHTLKHGSDPELKQAYDDVTAAINRLSSANGFQAVRNTEEIKGFLASYGQKLDEHYESLMVQITLQSEILEKGFDRQEETTRIGFQKTLSSMELMQEQIILLRSQLPQQTSVDLTQFFGSPTSPLARLEELKRSFVPGTTAWLEEDEVYKRWLNGDKPVVWILGDTGVGKSHIAYSVIRALQEKAKTQPKAIVAYFFFEKGNGAIKSARTALCSLGLQIISQDRKIRETLASRWKGQCCADWELSKIWAAIVPSYFDTNSSAKLYLVLDGVDELYNEIFTFMTLFPIEKGQDVNLRLQVLCTATGGMNVKILQEDEDYDIPEIDFTLERSRMGVESLIQARSSTLPKLAKFSDASKSRIRSALMDSNQGLLFVDHFLRNLDSKGLERPALKAIDRTIMPTDLPSLLQDTLYMCNANRSAEESEALKTIFSWMALSPRPLNLDEVNALMLYKSGKVVLDLEDEIAGKCSSVLEMTSSTLRSAVELESMMGKRDDIIEAGSNQGSSQTNVSASREQLPGDENLVLSFQTNRLKKHIVSAKQVQSNDLRTPPLDALVEILTVLADVVSKNDDGSNPVKDDARKRLRPFAATSWIYVLVQIQEVINAAEDEKDPIEPSNEQTRSIVEALYHITSDDGNRVSQVISRWGNTCYDDIDYDLFMVSKDYAEKALKLEQLPAEIRSWAEKTVAEPLNVLQTLADGHALQLFKQVLREPMRKSLELAWRARNTRWTESSSIYFSAETKRNPLRLTNEDIIDAICDPIEHWFLNTNAYRIMAIKSVELAVTDAEKFASFVTWADILFSSSADTTKTLELINKALKLPWPDLTDEGKQLLAWAVMIRARVWRYLNKLDDFVNDVEQSMAIWPQKTLVAFEELIGVLYRTGKLEAVLEKMEKWGPLRLAMSRGLDSDLNQKYQRAAHVTGNVSKMVTTYEGLIQNLDRLKWAAPTRYQLALAYRRSIGDAAKAKKLLYEILDGDSCIDPATNNFTADIPYRARRELAEIIFQEFGFACDLTKKHALLDEAESLPHRALGQAFSNDELELDPDSIHIARMYRKLGPLGKFYDILNKAFLTCVSSLKDDNPWNDRTALRRLCDVLACLPGLEKEAQIALTAQFFELESVDEFLAFNPLLPLDEASGDSVLALRPGHGPQVVCSGDCANNGEGFTTWSQPLYKCVICDSDWCEACHKARTSGGGSWTWMTYCNAGHQYVRGPVDGWDINDPGQMCLEGQEGIFFSEWLDQLRDVKWPKAWRDFLGGI